MSMPENIYHTLPQQLIRAMRLTVWHNGGDTGARYLLPTPGVGSTLHINLDLQQQDGTWKSYGRLLNVPWGTKPPTYSYPPSPNHAPDGSPDQKPQGYSGPRGEWSILDDSSCWGFTQEADPKTSSGLGGSRSTSMRVFYDAERFVKGKRARSERLLYGLGVEYCPICGGGHCLMPRRHAEDTLSISKECLSGSSA